MTKTGVAFITMDPNEEFHGEDVGIRGLVELEAEVIIARNDRFVPTTNLVDAISPTGAGIPMIFRESTSAVSLVSTPA